MWLLDRRLLWRYRAVAILPALSDRLPSPNILPKFQSVAGSPNMHVLFHVGLDSALTHYFLSSFNGGSKFLILFSHHSPLLRTSHNDLQELAYRE